MRSRAARKARRATRRRWLTVVVAALLAIAIGLGTLLQGGSRPAGATGLVFGCPEGTTSMGDFLGIELEAQREGFSTPEELIDLDINQMLAAIVGPPEGRNLDVDEDGLPDLRWNISFPTSNADTNLQTLWSRIGGDLSPIPPNTNPAPWLDIRVTLDRLPSDPDVVPYAVWGQATFEMNTPVDPADPDGPFTTEVNSARVGYDTRATDTVAPTRATFDVVISDNPPSNPDTGYLGARFATEYRAGNDPVGALVTPGTEPAITTLVQVGPETTPDRNLDLAVAWERAPAQLGFVKATACAAPVPTQTIAWDYRADQAGSGSDLPPTDADIDLVTGKAQGYNNHDAFAIHGTVEHVPEELTLGLTETNAVLRQNQHETSPGVFPDSSPAPNLVLDELLVTGKPENVGEAPTKLRATGKVAALPPITNLEITRDAVTGSLKSADLRFCPGTSWASAACQADVRAPDSIELVAADLLPGETTTLPALPGGTDPFVAYTERDRGGLLSPVKERRFRFGGRLNKLQHLNVLVPPPLTQQGVRATVQLAANLPKAKVIVDSDRRKVNFLGGQSNTTESAVGFTGDIAPFPAKATVTYAKTGGTPVLLAYDFGSTKATVNGSFSYDGDSASDLLQLRGRAALGDSATGMPTKATLTYKDLAANVKQIDYNPNGPTRAKVGAVLSTASDRAAKVRRRVWANGTLGGRVVAEWRSTPLGGFDLLDVRPCLTAPCPAGTALTKSVDARVVSGAPIKDEETKLLDAPDLPKIDQPDLYPAFTATPRGVTYVRLLDGQWGVAAELGVLRHVRFEDTGVTAGQKVCVETTDDKPADPRFGARIYLNASGRRTPNEPEKPLYVDGVLSRLPETVDVRLNDEGSASDASKPWLWLHTTSCGATAPPGREGKPGPADLDFTALVKTGDVKAQAVMTTDPLGKAPLALPKPDTSTTLGVNVHALVDGTTKLSAFDAAAHLKLPEHTVVYRPTFAACDEGAPLGCQDLPAWTRRERLDAGLRVMSTGTSWGAVDALVRMRSLLPVDDAPGPQPPNVCKANADGRLVCDLDVIGHIASVPAKFLVQGQLLTNARQPDAGLTFKLQNLAADPLAYPKWDTATVRVTDEAHPAATGVRTSSAGTPVDLYRVNLKGIAHELTAKVRFQGNETLPPNANVCPAYSYAGRGPMDVGYVDADLDVAGGTSVTANARIDVYGRFYANVVSPTAINGTVRSKIENVAVGEKFEQPEVFSTNDVNLCVDLDLPFEVKLVSTKDARISIDKTTWALTVPSSDPTQKMTMRVGELHNGSWLAGAVWFRHEAHFNPEGPGDWHYASGPGRRNLGLMPTAFWNGTAWEAYYKFTKWNQISTGETFGGIPAPLGCCVNNGTTKFTMDLFWNQSIRNDMYCRDDDDFCYVSFPGRPGWEFHKSVYLKGHYPRTDAVTFAEQAPTNPPTTSASYVFTWASGTTMPGPNEAETSAWMAESPTILTTAEGNQYRVYLGVDPDSANAYEPGDPVYWATTSIGIGTDASNGVARWRRELGSAWLGSCGVDQPKPSVLVGLEGDSWVLQCRLKGNVSILPSNHVQVTWTLEALRIDTPPGGDPVLHWVTLSTGSKVFDPSGYGGKPDVATATVNATAGQPVSLSSAFNAADITTGQQRKVWYFGDGSVFEGGNGALPSVPTVHTYAHPGTYPATLVYYAFDSSSKQWKVKHVIPQRVVVAP